jgi:UDP-N-acetylmuramate--alanine ligase
MDTFDILSLDTKSHIHFIGIGGISMSGLALILHNLGYKVTGSDAKSSSITQKLESTGIKVSIGHAASNVVGANVIVYTAAVKNDNVEMIRAKELNLPIIERSTLLGEIMRKYKYSIGISGTHGKTTTTSMISRIFVDANLDPTISVGGELDFLGGNLRIGKSEYFIAEACEYVDSFLKFHPYIGCILNIDADHLDYFKDIDAIANSFEKYANLIAKEGFLIANIDDGRVASLTKNVSCNVITYALKKDANYTAGNIVFNSRGCAEFDVINNGKNLGRICLSIPGIHNVYNSLAAIGCSMALGVDFKQCQTSISKFKGAKRRFEYKGSFNNVTVIDDYAHHPTEVKATLSASVNYPHNRVWCIFQPHTYTRTKLLLNEFAKAFSDIDKIIITDIYAAREKDTGEIHAKDLAQKIKEQGKDAVYIQDFDSICEFLKDNVKDNDVVITMGAGDVYKVGEMLVSQN